MTAPAVFGISLHTPAGAQLDDLNGINSFALAKAKGEGGAGKFTFPYSDALFAKLGREQLIDVARNGKRLFETLWVIKHPHPYYDDQNAAWLDIHVIDLAKMVAEARISAYYAGSAQSSKTGYADDLCKAIVRENCTSAATDTTRVIPNLTVAADESKAAITSKGFSYRNVGAVLNEICDDSTQRGTFCTWDVVCTQAPGAGSVGFEFRTYTGQRGNDHRYPAGAAGALWLSPEAGNIAKASVDFDYTEERNAIYAGGRGEGAERVIKTAISAAATASLYARSEKFVNASSASGAADDEFVQGEANAALMAERARVSFDGQLNQTDTCQFGVHYDYGDYLTAQAFRQAFDCRLDGVGIKFSRDAGETITAILRSEA